MEDVHPEVDFLQTDADLRYAVRAEEEASKNLHASHKADMTQLNHKQSVSIDQDQSTGGQTQRRTIQSKKRTVRRGGQNHVPKDKKTGWKGQKEPTLSAISERLASSNMNMLTTLDAGRLDPFDVYPQSNLPKYLQSLIDHTLNHVINAYLASDKRQEAEHTRALIIGEALADPLMWYPVMMSGITHFAYVHEQAQPDRSLTENHAGKVHRLLRLSYKTETIRQIRAALERENGVPSDATLLAISTLMSHGSSHNDDLVFSKQADPIQMRKAFGTATDMHYYSSITFDYEHWYSIVRFIKKVRGGITGIRWPLMQQTVQLIDTTVAWRNLESPSLSALVPTSMIVSIATHRPDEIANSQMRNSLSSLPPGWRTSPEHPHADLYQCLQHMRTLVTRYNQYQRRLTITQANLRPDHRLIIYTRGLVMHDLLELPALTTDGQGATGTYELIRHAALAFMQLVLFPVTSVNNLPHKILTQMHPLLQLCWKVQADQERNASSIYAEIDYFKPLTSPSSKAAREDAHVTGSLVLWAWMLAGMLAFEHLQTQQDSTWVDALAPMVDDFAIRPEKGSWSMVKGVMETFLWLASECDGPGQRWWNYACLWIDARRRERNAAAATSLAEGY